MSPSRGLGDVYKRQRREPGSWRCRDVRSRAARRHPRRGNAPCLSPCCRWNSTAMLPLGGAHWKTAMRDRALSLRDVLARHRWAIGLMESRRRPGPSNLRHHDAVIGKLRSAGFDIAMVAHAYSLLDGYIYGFALTKMNIPFETTDEMAAMAQDMFEPFPVSYTHL